MEGPLIKIDHFVLVVNKHGRHRQFLFLIGQFKKKIFSFEFAWPNEPKLVRKHIYGRFSMKNAYFGPIREKHGLHRKFLFLIG